MIDLIVKAAFDFGDKVQMEAYPDIIGMVIEYELKPNALIKYVINWNDNTISSHYDFELKIIDVNG